MTTRGMDKESFARIAELLDRGVEVARMVDSKVGGTKMKEFLDGLGDGENFKEIAQLRNEVAGWAGTFPVPWR